MSISRAKGEYLLVTTERLTTLQKAKTKSLLYIKNSEGVFINYNKKTYYPTKGQNKELVLYQELKIV